MTPQSAASVTAPAPASAPLTLATRRAVLLTTVLTAAGVAAVWASETAMAQLAASDRVAYPLLVAFFSGLALLLWQRPGQLLLVQRLAPLGLASYFVVNFADVLLSDAAPDIYALATLSCWLMAAHLMFFVTWPPRLALLLSGLLTGLTLAPAAWAKLGVAAGPTWHDGLQPLLMNSLVAQCFLVAVMYGTASQLARLVQLVPVGDAPHGRALTVDDMLQLRLRDLERARDAAEQASQAKSRFLAVMSHELRTPLHGVLGAAELLQRVDAGAAQRHEWLSMVQRGGQHLLRLIEDLLDVSRIEAGRLTLQSRPLDVRRCIGEAIAAVQPLADDKALRLDCQLAQSLPDAMQGDAMRLTQVLINLLGNAIKFTDQGHVSLRARHDAADGLVLEVEDTGIGIAPADQAQVFDAFVQADGGSTRRHGGSGLGLAITRQLVVLMQGRIALRSAAGQGACFTVTLPLPVLSPAPTPMPAVAPAFVDAASATAATTAPAAMDLQGRRLLVVDDDAVNVTIASHMLQALGAEVTAASDGEAALQCLRAQHFDVVLMDWRMPGMDGLQATRLLRAGAAGVAARQVPVIGLTANAFGEDRTTCLNAGMDEVLVKPVDSRQLQVAVLAQLARVSQLSQLPHSPHKPHGSRTSGLAGG